jgi:hypothetical protein
MHRARLNAGLVAATVAVCLAGCSASGGSGLKVKNEDVEKQISTQLGKSTGAEITDVKCPKDLKGKKGAETRCTLQNGPRKYGVTVEVTEVKGKDVKFHIQVDETPQ